MIKAICLLSLYNDCTFKIIMKYLSCNEVVIYVTQAVRLDTYSIIFLH